MIFDTYIHLLDLTSIDQKIITVLLIVLLIIYEFSGENKNYKSGRKLLIPFIITLGITVGIIIIQSVL